jgi:hypothetical protein
MELWYHKRWCSHDQHRQKQACSATIISDTHYYFRSLHRLYRLFVLLHQLEGSSHPLLSFATMLNGPIPTIPASFYTCSPLDSLAQQVTLSSLRAARTATKHVFP